MTTITQKKIFAALPKTTRGKSSSINGDPKGKNFLYCNSNFVFIRNINDLSECDVYSQHAKEASCAKYAPSGFYICSGDISGKIRIWDTVNEEHILKYEYQPIGGMIKDIDWTEDSKRIVLGGEGRENFAVAIMWDTGTSVGSLAGCSKSVNGVAVKQNRPYRCAVASEDMSSCFFEGPPFKYTKTANDHSNFVNCVRYSPDGSKYITAGADGMMYMYEGKTGDLIGSLPDGEKAHKGGIYGICFNKDGSKLLTCSADKTAKIWNVESKTEETTFVLGTALDDMQVACLWQGDQIISLSLSGFINYLDPENPSEPKKIVKGHNKPIMSMAVSEDNSTIYTGDISGRIIKWDIDSSESDDFKGKGPTNQVTAMAMDGDNLAAISMDDTLRFMVASSGKFEGDVIKMDSQPTGLACKDGVTVVACINEVVVVQGGKVLSKLKLSEADNTCVSIRPGGAEVAVGSNKGIHICSLSSGALKEAKFIKVPDTSVVTYSPDGAFLAASAKNFVKMFEVDADYKDHIDQWGGKHSGTVRSIAWAPDSTKFMSGSLDQHICLWKQGQFKDSKTMVKAHPISDVRGIHWLDNNTVVTTARDCTVKIWDVSE